MSNEAAAGDMTAMAGAIDSASVFNDATASSRDSAMMKRSSGYLFANSWPDSPIKMIFLM